MCGTGGIGRIAHCGAPPLGPTVPRNVRNPNVGGGASPIRPRGPGEPPFTPDASSSDARLQSRPASPSDQGAQDGAKGPIRSPSGAPQAERAARATEAQPNRGQAEGAEVRPRLAGQRLGASGRVENAVSGFERSPPGAHSVSALTGTEPTRPRQADAERPGGAGPTFPQAALAEVGGVRFRPSRTVEEGAFNSPLAPPWPRTTEGIVETLKHRYPLVDQLPAHADKVQRAFMKLVSSDPRAFARRVAQKFKMDQQRRTAERNAHITKAVSDVLMENPMASGAEIADRVEGRVRSKALKSQFRAGETDTYLEAFRLALSEGKDVPAANRLALKRIPIPVVVEVDAIKVASGDFANGPKKSGFKHNPLDAIDGPKVGAALYNTALHPAATLLSALVLEEVVKDATERPSDYGFDQVDRLALAMMCGGVAAGKGFTSKNVALPVHFIYDADGESNTTAFEGVLALAKASKIDFLLVGIHTDPIAAYIRSLYRALDPENGEGRIPGEIASVSSHSDGVANMLRFAQRLKETKEGHPLILTNTTDPPSLLPLDHIRVPQFEALLPEVFRITDHIREHGRLPDEVKARFDKIPFMRDDIIPRLERALTDPKNEPMTQLVLGRLAEDRDALRSYYTAR